MLYNFLKILARLSIPFYFSSVEIIGKENIPKEGRPIVLAPNHQNAFLDAIVIAVYYKHPVYFLARASVFKGLFNKFLRAINMRPVFRIRDGYENLSKNHEVFDECSQLLADNKTLLVFPEADHGEEYYLRKLSRGLPRIVSQAHFESNVNVDIIPVGINYTNHFFSGGKLFLNFGPSLNVSSVLDNNLQTGYNLNTIRSSIESHLKKLMLLPDKDSDYEKSKAFIICEGHKNTFKSLKQKMKSGDLVFNESTFIQKCIIKLLTVPNFPFYALIWTVLKLKVPKQIFHASMKFAAIMLVSWLWILCVLAVSFILKGALFALFVLGVCILSAYFRAKFISMARFYYDSNI